MIGGATKPLPTVRVCFIGDSITVGYDDIQPNPNLLNGFRPGTAALLQGSKQVLWTYVGNVYWPGTSPPTQTYQGTSGATIQLRTSDLLTYFGQAAIAQGLGVVGGCSQVDVARFLLGTNNVVPDPGATITNYTALLNAFFLKFPGKAASCAMIPPCRSDLGFGATIAAMNADIATVVAAQVALGRAAILEADAGLVNADYAAGGVHLIASGNAKEAIVASNGIIAAATLAGLPGFT